MSPRGTGDWESRMAIDSESLLGKIAITHNFMTPKQVNECLDIQTRIRTYGLGEKKIGEIALERGFLTSQQLQLLLNIQRAVQEERRKQEQAARPTPAPAPALPRRRARTPAPPVPLLKPPPHRVQHAPAARSKIEVYADQIKMGRVTTIVGLGIAAIVVVVILAKAGGGNSRPSNNDQGGGHIPFIDPNAGMAAEQQRIALQRAQDAEKLYRELKEWAAKNRGKKEDIIRRCNRIATDYAETEAAVKASLLGDFYADLPDLPAAGGATDQQKATQASQIYMKLSMQALRLRSREQWAKAIEVYEQFPDTYEDTPFYPKVQNEIKKLRQQIAKKYAADLHTINRLIGARRYDEARKYLAKIENYASHELVIAVQRELDAYIAQVEKAPGHVPAAKSEDVLLAERHRVAESMFWRNMYSDSLKVFLELAENTGFAASHPEMRGRIKDLERCISVLDAVTKSILKSKGRKRTLYLENRGSVYAEIFDVQDHIILAYEKGRGDFEIPLNDLTTNSLLLYAKKNLPSKPAETELALGAFVLSRGLVKEAEKYIYRAAKKDAPNDEVARLLERLEEKPPATLDEGLAGIAKSDPKDSPNAARLFGKAEALFGKGKFAEALALYKELLKKFPTSAIVTQKKDAIAGNIASCEENLSSPLARVFSGKVIERNDLGKGVVEVSYSFESDKQLADWKEYNWYSIFDMHDSNWHIVNGELSGNGSRGFLWKGEIDGDVKVEFDAYSTSAERQNIQATICDNGEGWNYLFAVGLTELGNAKDIIRRNEKFSFGKEIAKRPSDAKSFTTYHVRIVKKGSNLTLYVDDKLVLKAKHKLYKKGHVGLFAIGSTVRFDNVTITGRLDKAWLRKHAK